MTFDELSFVQRSFNAIRRSTLVCFASLAATNAFAALQPVSEAPLALDQRAECRFLADGATECVDTFRYTILSDAGREMVSRIEINHRATDTFKIDKAEVIQPGQKPVALEKSQIDTRMAPNPAQGFVSDKQTSLAFPNLRIGSTVVYSVRQRYAPVPFATQFHYSRTFAPSSVRYDRFHAEFNAERPIKYRSDMMDGFTITPSSDAKKLTVDLNKPRFSSFINEPGNGFIRRYPRLELGSSLDLQDNFGAFAKRYNALLAASLPARATAAVAKAKSLAPRQRVAAFMQYLNENFRYLNDWRASERGFVPFSLAEIEQHGYGDCKDLSMLLTAMLRASGIKAEPVWVARGEFALPLIAPNIYAPDHAIVRAEVDGAVWWLDPTNPMFAPGLTYSDIQDRWALVIGADGVVRQDTIPLPAPRTGIDVTMKTRLANGEQGEVNATLALGGGPLMDLSAADRNDGKSVNDKSICNMVATEPGRCDVQRQATGFLVPDQYKVNAQVVDLRALDAHANQYSFSRPSLTELWDSLARYKRNGQMSDIYQGAPETTKADVTLVAKRTEGQVRECAVRNRWFDLELSGKPSADGYRYRYSLTNKVAWLTHDEIVSAEFQKMVEQSRACVSGLQFAVQPLKG
jgi:transglutaminase-like putative cysteine protease